MTQKLLPARPYLIQMKTTNLVTLPTAFNTVNEGFILNLVIFKKLKLSLHDEAEEEKTQWINNRSLQHPRFNSLWRSSGIITEIDRIARQVFKAFLTVGVLLWDRNTKLRRAKTSRTVDKTITHNALRRLKNHKSESDTYPRLQMWKQARHVGKSSGQRMHILLTSSGRNNTGSPAEWCTSKPHSRTSPAGWNVVVDHNSSPGETWLGQSRRKRSRQAATVSKAMKAG